MHNLTSNLLIEQVLKPQVIIGSALNSGNIDTQGVGALSVAVLVGLSGDTLSGSVHIALKIEHADDNGSGAPGSYAACTDDDVLNITGLSSGVFVDIDSGSEDEKRYVLDYIGGKRFVKVTATPTGLTNGTPIAMLTLKGNLTQKPADNS